MVKEKLKKIFVILLILVIGVLTIKGNSVSAKKVTFKEAEYTDEYKNWLKLSKEEREKVIQPIMYKIQTSAYKTNNPLKIARMAGSSLDQKFTLRDYIAQNVVVKNQGDTNSCWAFSSLAALETNLALRDYYNGVTPKVYDFSERHMEYATSREFANGQINEKGFNRKVGSGGNYYFYMPYLTNGWGAIDEKDMPFENNENIISLDKIQNKKVKTQVYDTIVFDTTLSVEELQKQMKNHIKNYGAIDALIHGTPDLDNSECYKNDTGAIYCSDSVFHKMDHAIAIIGWDDTYSRKNFKQDPGIDGAWIIKNSWGTGFEYTLEEMKQAFFEEYPNEFKQIGYNSVSEIPDEFIKELCREAGYTIENDKVKFNIGDNGIMYVSYKDVNVYKQLSGIIKATDKIDYENIYQYNELGNHYTIYLTDSTVYLANIFEKKTTGKEYLTQVSIYAPQTYTCKVYVNPNGEGKSKSDLQLVQLKAGESETFGIGYHTLEFLEPIEIKSDKFAVVLELKSNKSSTYLSLEANSPDVDFDDYVKVETGKCFVTTAKNFESNVWNDLSKMSDLNSSLVKSDSTIKAFTVSKVEDDSLKDIQITTPPTKTTYIEGQNFEKTGMVVKANYNNGETKEITDYIIKDGTNLKKEQTSVTIEFEGKTVTQAITVEKNSVASIKVKTPPTKTTYYAGENFDKTGMIIEATYKNGDKEEITDYTIKDGTNLKVEQTSVTIEYEGVSTTQPITVTESNVVSITVKTPPTKTTYYAGENFDKTGMIVEATYKGETKEEVTDYTIKNGENLKLGQTEIIINYKGKETGQAITVKENSLIKIEVKTAPTKTTYYEGENFDKTGMVILATYENGNTKEVQDYTIENGTNLKLDQKTVTITYEEKEVAQTITVKEKPVEQPENSNFDKATAMGKNAKLYTYIEKNKEEYIEFDIEVKNIEKSKVSDKCEYYYYLSPDQVETNISNWVKIEKGEIKNGKLVFKVSSKEIINYIEASNSDILYLYIKEVATKGEIEKTLITNSIKIESEGGLEIYIDDVKFEDDYEQQPEDEDDGKDNTVADKELPDTGAKIIFSIVLVLVIVFVVIKFINYRKLKDIK